MAQGLPILLDVDKPEIASYNDMAQRLASDPVGQCIIVHLFLQLFVLHILGVRPECVAQPKNAHIKPRDWLTDGVATSLTSLSVSSAVG